MRGPVLRTGLLNHDGLVLNPVALAYALPLSRSGLVNDRASQPTVSAYLAQVTHRRGGLNLPSVRVEVSG